MQSDWARLRAVKGSFPFRVITEANPNRRRVAHVSRLRAYSGAARDLHLYRDPALLGPFQARARGPAAGAAPPSAPRAASRRAAARRAASRDRQGQGQADQPLDAAASSDDEELVFDVDRILGVKVLRDGSVRYRVKWPAGYPVAEATYEPWDNLASCSPFREYVESSLSGRANR